MNIKGSSGDEADSVSYTVVDIRIHSILWGYLYIYQPEKCVSLLKEHKLLEQHILLPLSMWFNKENIENLLVLRMKNDFVWDLANKNYTSFLEMVQQGAKLGFNLSAPYVCIAFCARPRDPEQVLDEYSSDAAQLATFAENLIVAERQRRKKSIMFADRGLQFIVYMDLSGDATNTLVEEFISYLDSSFALEYPDYQLFWGISDTSPENSELFHQLCQNAQLALHYCLSDKNSKRIFTYQDTMFQQVISELTHNGSIKTLALETLAPLVEFDKTSSMELYHTLIEFIKNDCNTSQTARSLHLNRQSLLYRIKKIEILTGMSLSQRKDLFLLELFTRIQSYY